jgi:NADP-dependent 3-hydroxy acid dehydrogenase YdfG
MATVDDEQLYEYASKLQGAVVLITGGANGIGRTAAMDFVKYG